MTGMMISMGMGMLTGLLLGAILGLLIGKMFVATEIAIFIGVVIGFCIGKPIHLIASLDGLLAGIMGGMMGAMLGVMIQSESPIFTLAYLIFVFALSCLLIILLIQKEVLKKQSSAYQGQRPLVPSNFTRFFFVILLSLSIFLLLAINLDPTLPVNTNHSDHMHMH